MLLLLLLKLLLLLLLLIPETYLLRLVKIWSVMIVVSFVTTPTQPDFDQTLNAGFWDQQQ